MTVCVKQICVHPYSLKFSRVKIFCGFHGFGVPTKILASKSLSYSIIQCSTSAIHETDKFTIPQNF